MNLRPHRSIQGRILIELFRWYRFATPPLRRTFFGSSATGAIARGWRARPATGFRSCGPRLFTIVLVAPEFGQMHFYALEYRFRIYLFFFFFSIMRTRRGSCSRRSEPPARVARVIRLKKKKKKLKTFRRTCFSIIIQLAYYTRGNTHSSIMLCRVVRSRQQIC